jgi:hypothetical protein
MNAVHDRPWSKPPGSRRSPGRSPLGARRQRPSGKSAEKLRWFAMVIKTGMVIVEHLVLCNLWPHGSGAARASPEVRPPRGRFSRVGRGARSCREEPATAGYQGGNERSGRRLGSAMLRNQIGSQRVACPDASFYPNGNTRSVVTVAPNRLRLFQCNALRVELKHWRKRLLSR